MRVLKDTKLGGFSLIAAFLLLWEILARSEAVAAVSLTSTVRGGWKAHLGRPPERNCL